MIIENTKHSPEFWEHLIARALAGDPQELDRHVLSMLTSRSIQPLDLLSIADRFLSLGWFELALRFYLRVLVLDESSFRGWFSTGLCQQQLGLMSQAVSSYRVAVQRADVAQMSVVHSNMAAALVSLSNLNASEHHARHALIFDPGLAQAFYNLALSLERRLPDVAMRCYGRSILLNPYFAQAHTNLGKLYQEQGGFDSALQRHGAALILAPNLEEAIHNQATVLSELREFDRAIQSLRRALQLRPDFPNAHLGLSMTLLMLGEYLEGWAENEWRFLEHVQYGVRARSHAPRLSPELLPQVSGKKVLLFWEQGLGDTLHFCRYAKSLADRGASVVLNVQSELLSITKSLDPRIEVTDASYDRPDCQFHAYLMSLAYIFGTELDTIPAETPYLFASLEFIERWRPRVLSRGRPRIGFVCSGAPSFKNDHNRSIPLSAFAKLLELPFDFHCLQKVIRADDEAIAKQYSNFYLHSQAIDSFDDTAALVEHMDLVISVDTSVAHLVGALGKPLWLMIPYTPDNRWFLDRSDSPWYPTATLYRQPERGLWTPVINRIRADLLKRFARAIT